MSEVGHRRIGLGHQDQAAYAATMLRAFKAPAAMR